MIDITPQETKAIKVKKGPGRPNKPDEKTQARRNEIMKAIEITGGYGMPVKELASRHNVAERTIYKDVEYLLKNIPRPNIQEIGKKFKVSYEVILRKAHAMLANPDHKIQVEGAKLIMDAEERYRIFLEKYGYKDIHVENSMPINVTVDNRSVEVVNVKFEIPKELEEYNK